ncbi:MAG: aminomethyl-transferring glycine dehydrogenase [Balneolaceae bacterium]
MPLPCLQTQNLLETKPPDPMQIDFSRESFLDRHLGPDSSEIEIMLSKIGVESLSRLVDEALPAGIRSELDLDLPDPLDEISMLRRLRKIAGRNKIFQTFIGMGYYDTNTPHVIQRNVLENPGWYTAYTPYQAEISQGRLEALLNFQTMVTELTGMEIANSSLLDEATAAAEAMSMQLDLRRGEKRKSALKYVVSKNCHPQTIAVLTGRAEPLGIRIELASPGSVNWSDPDLFGALLQYPGTDGLVEDYTEVISNAHENSVTVAVATDLLALTLLKPPGEMDADVVIGSTQRFGVPLWYGGPHAAFFATREEFQRKVPGRIIGVTRDREGNPACRMALQTREQHIRREKATSNICTAQVLLAVTAGFYAVWHGPEGLKRIAERIQTLTTLTAAGLEKMGYRIENHTWFDTLSVRVEPERLEAIRREALKRGVNLRYSGDSTIGISFDEAKEPDDIVILLSIFSQTPANELPIDPFAESDHKSRNLPTGLQRSSPFLEQAVFNRYHSEHEMLRYMKWLENRDMDLTHSMIPLGSCTMKLNATAEMIPISWAEFASIHPFVPEEQALGYRELISELELWLSRITEFPGVSLQPNSGAQGELAGLMLIRAWHRNRGDHSRNVCIVPSSAHGTNPASAVMAGMDVVVTRCDEHGNIDLDDLREKAESCRDSLAALMVTYPSTHGVFEEDIREICELIHEFGGLVYMDGANMNAQVGLTSPARIGADVCHLNLHKTFCIPHGGGGPGMGPIAVNEKLKPYLPSHPLSNCGGENGISPVSAAPWGSAGILPISWAYIRMLGSRGLTEATRVAILSANYMMERLKEHYPVLYTGRNGRAAHEFIVDVREIRQSTGVDAIDLAKRLMDYGFHAPTVSFPVTGTLMIEPTESESLEEIDRFCDAMLSIREEIREIEEGRAGRDENLLKNAPHTLRTVTSDTWPWPYSRESAAFPMPFLRFNKVWPSVSRVDEAHGDRNLICTCPPVEEYETSKKEPVL